MNRITAIFAITALAALASCTTSGGPQAPGMARATCARAADAATAEARIITQTNDLRQAQGLPALRASARLRQVAQAHACDNAARASFSHAGSDGSTLQTRLDRGGYALRTAAENTGLGFDGAPDRMQAFWENSAGHRANLLNPKVTEVGLGLARGPGGPAWVLVLAQPR